MAMEGGARTVRLAEAVEPVPPSVDEIAPEVLLFKPAVEPVTLTEREQELLAARVPEDKLTVDAPAAAVAVPLQVLVTAGVVETTTPAGKVSEKARPESGEALGLVTVKVSVEEPFKGMLAGAKALAKVGGAMTVTDALEVLPMPPSVEAMVTLLFLTPAVVP